LFLTVCDSHRVIGNPMSDDLWRIVCGLGALCEQDRVIPAFRMALATHKPTTIVEHGPEIAYITQLSANGEFYSAMNYPVGFRQKADDGVTYEVRQIGRDRRAWSPA
jgi:hypothetical protein